MLKYAELAIKNKQNDHLRNVEGTFHAVAAAMGHLKMDRFHEYLQSFEERKKVDAQKTVEKMKEQGFEIEEQ